MRLASCLLTQHTRTCSHNGVSEICLEARKGCVRMIRALSLDVLVVVADCQNDDVRHLDGARGTTSQYSLTQHLDTSKTHSPGRVLGPPKFQWSRSRGCSCPVKRQLDIAQNQPHFRKPSKLIHLSNENIDVWASCRDQEVGYRCPKRLDAAARAGESETLQRSSTDRRQIDQELRPLTYPSALFCGVVSPGQNASP